MVCAIAGWRLRGIMGIDPPHYMDRGLGFPSKPSEEGEVCRAVVRSKYVL